MAPHATIEGQARAKVKSRHLCIDAICIIHHLDERNEQIELVRSVYEAASTVIIWLSDDDGDRGNEKYVIEGMTPSHDGQKSMTEVEKVFTAQVPWYSLALFVAAPWFCRTWIIQEHVAGLSRQNKDPVFYYGKSGSLFWKIS